MSTYSPNLVQNALHKVQGMTPHMEVRKSSSIPLGASAGYRSCSQTNHEHAFSPFKMKLVPEPRYVC